MSDDFVPSRPSSEWVIYDDWGNPIMGDGGCTGTPDKLGPWDWSHCCLVHDRGGTDDELRACIQAVVPDWAAGLVCIAIAIMVMVRPAYEWLQRRRIVK